MSGFSSYVLGYNIVVLLLENLKFENMWLVFLCMLSLIILQLAFNDYQSATQSSLWLMKSTHNAWNMLDLDQFC